MLRDADSRCLGDHLHFKLRGRKPSQSRERPQRVVKCLHVSEDVRLSSGACLVLKDTAHSRIYDRVLEMCPPVCCTGGNFRKKAAQDKLGLLKELMNE